MNSPSTSGSSSFPYVQKEISSDWNNREFIQVISANIKKISDSLNAFGRLVSPLIFPLFMSPQKILLVGLA